MSKKNLQVQRINTKGPLVGECNICGNVGRLTKDHTPPKCCSLGTPVELRNLHDRVVSPNDQRQKPRTFRTGVTFRSLCARCNNELLGARYDPALGEFSQKVRTLANSPLTLPDVVAIDVRPQAVMRSILGHLAAQGVSRYQKGELTEPLREYILDETATLPASIRLYCWLYPHRHQVLVRDASRINHFASGEPPFSFWLMKFFPLAFMCTFGEPPQRLFSLLNFDQFGSVPIHHVQTVGLRLRPLVPAQWPEHPGDDAAILYGEQAMVASPTGRIHRT